MRSTGQKHLPHYRQTITTVLFSIAIAALPLVTGCAPRQSAVPTPETPAVTTEVTTDEQNSASVSATDGNNNSNTNVTIGGNAYVDLNYGLTVNTGTSVKVRPSSHDGNPGNNSYSVGTRVTIGKGNNTIGIRVSDSEYPAGTKIQVTRPDGTMISHRVTEPTKHKDLPTEIRDALDGTQIVFGSNNSNSGGAQAVGGGSGNIVINRGNGDNNIINVINAGKYQAGAEIWITKPNGKKTYRKLDRDMTWEELPAEIREAFASSTPGLKIKYKTAGNEGYHVEFETGKKRPCICPCCKPAKNKSIP